MNTTDSGLQFDDTTVGTGATAQAGQQVSVHYTGWLHDPTKADGQIGEHTSELQSPC